MADMRLTKRLEDGQAVMDCKNCELKELQMCTALGCRNRLKDRLAEYEDAAANVAPVRHGRWKLVGADKRGRGGNWECTGRDGCGKSYPYRCDYCPNCGAKMQGCAEHVNND